MKTDKANRIAIIGCGAITEAGHLPAALAVQCLTKIVLVDKDNERVRRLAGRSPLCTTAADCRDLAGEVDAAIVALPPALHAPVSCELLRQGIPVLVEKPMARTIAECDAMLQAATETGATLAVGFVRRFRWAYRLAKRIIESNLLGPLLTVDVSEGGIFDWPVASPFFLDRQAAGGGVLADAGVHVLDALVWWLGDLTVTNYRDDDMGGIEADCEMAFAAGNGIAGRIELSRTRAMKNTTRLIGTNGSLEIRAFTNEITLRLQDCSSDASSHLLAGLDNQRMLNVRGGVCIEGPASEAIFTDQLRDFLTAIENRRSPMVDGAQGRKSLALVEQCYASRQRLEHPWVFEGAAVASGGSQ